MRISDWSSDVCSSDLAAVAIAAVAVALVATGVIAFAVAVAVALAALGGFSFAVGRSGKTGERQPDAAGGCQGNEAGRNTHDQKPYSVRCKRSVVPRGREKRRNGCQSLRILQNIPTGLCQIGKASCRERGCQ